MQSANRTDGQPEQPYECSQPLSRPPTVLVHKLLSALPTLCPTCVCYPPKPINMRCVYFPTRFLLSPPILRPTVFTTPNTQTFLSTDQQTQKTHTFPIEIVSVLFGDMNLTSTVLVNLTLNVLPCRRRVHLHSVPSTSPLMSPSFRCVDSSSRASS